MTTSMCFLCEVSPQKASFVEIGDGEEHSLRLQLGVGPTEAVLQRRGPAPVQVGSPLGATVAGNLVSGFVALGRRRDRINYACFD